MSIGDLRKDWHELSVCSVSSLEALSILHPGGPFDTPHASVAWVVLSLSRLDTECEELKRTRTSVVVCLSCYLRCPRNLGVYAYIRLLSPVHQGVILYQY